MAFTDAISQLTGNSTFYDWFNKENNEIIAKLNQLKISGATSGDGVLVTIGATTGLASFSIGGTSSTIQAGLTFAGSINFTGSVTVPKTSYRITGITSGTTGYTFGSVIRITSSGYTAARGDDPDSAEVVGVLSERTTNYSVVTLLGKIDGDFTGVAGSTLSPGCIYFLSPVTAGNVTTTEPNTIGQVSKPVLMGLGETSGIVLQYRGNYLYSSELGPGISGSNIITVAFSSSPVDPRNYGFSAGMYLSFAPNIINGSTFFKGYLADTGRTAINGWFLSGNYQTMIDLYYEANPDLWYSQYSILPWEDDFCVGMIQNITDNAGTLTYEIVTRGFSSTIPKTVSTRGATAAGFWIFNNPIRSQGVGATYNITTGANQLQRHDSGNVQGSYFGISSPVFNAGAAFENNPTKYFVNPRANVTISSPGSSPSGQAAFRRSDSTDIIQDNINYAFNGDFSIWNRNVGNNSRYTGTDDVYFADNWIRRIDSSGTITAFVGKSGINFGSTEIEGNPQSCAEIKFIAGPSGSGPTGSFSVGHVFDGVDAFNEKSFTVSFYLKTSTNGHQINVYLAKYGGGSQISKEIISSLTSTTTWTKYTFDYSDHIGTVSTNYDDGYVEIGIDMNPMVVDLYDTVTPTSSNIFTSLASFVVYKGQYANPVHKFESYDEKLKKAQRYYYSTYKQNQTIGSETMENEVDPDLNAFTFQYLPGTPYGLLKLPTTMREVPAVSIYSPTGTISNPEMYNVTASRDLKNTAGTKGFNNANRTTTLGNPTVSTKQDETTIKIIAMEGVVPYDVISCHVVADASYPI